MATSTMVCLRRLTTGLFLTLVISQQWIMSVLDQSLDVETLAQMEEMGSAATMDPVANIGRNLEGTKSQAQAKAQATAPKRATDGKKLIQPHQNQPNKNQRQPEKAQEKPKGNQQREKAQDRRTAEEPPPKPQQNKSKIKGQRQSEKAPSKQQEGETEAERRAKKRERFREWHRQKAERQARKAAEKEKQENEGKPEEKQENEGKSEENDNTVNNTDDLHPDVPPPTEEEQQKRGFWYPPFHNAKVSPAVQQVLSKYQVRKRQESPVSLQKLKEIVLKALANPHSWTPYGSPQSTSDPSHRVQNIYYTNLAKNLARREITETYLQELQQNTGIPFRRMEAQKGDTDVCTPKNFDTKCIGVSGLAYSLLNILDTQNVTGPTLVVEDDWVWQDSTSFDRLYAAMDMLPDDWDVVRLDCWELSQKRFAATVSDPYLINTTTYTTPDNEWCRNDRLCARRFYGGTHAMLWRGRPSSNTKLKQTWSIRPYDDVDGRISTEGGRRFGLVSYCLNLGLGSFVEIPTEGSDIPKDQEDDNQARL